MKPHFRDGYVIRLTVSNGSARMLLQTRASVSPAFTAGMRSISQKERASQAECLLENRKRFRDEWEE